MKSLWVLVHLRYLQYLRSAFRLSYALDIRCALMKHPAQPLTGGTPRFLFCNRKVHHCFKKNAFGFYFLYVYLMLTALGKSQLGDHSQVCNVFYHSHVTNSSHTRGVGVGAFHVFVFAHACDPTKHLHTLFTNSDNGRLWPV